MNPPDALFESVAICAPERALNAFDAIGNRSGRCHHRLRALFAPFCAIDAKVGFNWPTAALVYFAAYSYLHHPPQTGPSSVRINNRDDG
jgi:hypothetical protein